MKYLAMIAATGLMISALSACSDNKAPPMPATSSEEMVQPQMPQSTSDNAPAASEATEASAEAPTSQSNPSDEQMTGATSQE